MAAVLVSVLDKTGLEEFIKELVKIKPDYKIIGTTSTAKHLSDVGIDCISIDKVTGFPEILGGRVKTLHPNVFGGILSRDTDDDRATLKEHGIEEIDMVIVNLYAFEQKLKENLPEDKMIEHIDIGGVSLIRAAGKNFSRVNIICDPSQYKEVLAQIKDSGKTSYDFRKKLAAKAFQHTANYDRIISDYFARICSEGKTNGETESFPKQVTLSLQQNQSLRYGENPHQAAAWYDAGSKGSPFQQLQGKELSSNNILDVYSLVTILREFSSHKKIMSCIIKHNNPCGVALGKTAMEAFEKAYNADPLSAFGGVYGFTSEVDGPLAQKIIEGFVEIVLAPSFNKEALEAFSKKKNIRVLEVKKEFLEPLPYDSVKARDLQDFGWILEKSQEKPKQLSEFECVTDDKNLSDAQKEDIEFAWKIVRHLTSNAIFVAKDGVSLGFGIGQTSRVASVKIALTQAGENAKGAVMASDAFFPATDNIDEASKAGISIIVQPGGSIKDADVIAACKSNKISMLFTGQRCFKH